MVSIVPTELEGIVSPQTLVLNNIFSKVGQSEKCYQKKKKIRITANFKNYAMDRWKTKNKKETEILTRKVKTEPTATKILDKS